MPNCYLCGNPLDPKKPLTRRRVKTGEWLRKGYQRNRVLATQYHYGMRIVCKQCSQYVDRMQWLEECLRHMGIAIALVFLLLLLEWAKHVG